jgi:hypothetical protein
MTTIGSSGSRLNQRRRPGRPTRLTDHVRQRFFQALDLGYNRTDAIRFAGVGEATFYRWMADDRPEYREFREAVERAEIEREDARGDVSLRVTAVGNLHRLSRRNTRALLTWLVMDSPDEWGRALSVVDKGRNNLRRSARRARGPNS